jgi:hypothetical protein
MIIYGFGDKSIRGRRVEGSELQKWEHELHEEKRSQKKRIFSVSIFVWFEPLIRDIRVPRFTVSFPVDDAHGRVV